MSLTPPLISALTAGILIIMQLVLMVGVILARRSNQQSLGDGGKSNVLRAIRRHGNLAENAALFVAGFTLLEMLGGNRTSLELLCAAFVVGRISHAIGLSMEKTVNRFRFAGIGLTIIVGITLALRLVQIALPHLT
jgi:uncharacterized membrane protein YecN with MAPEG domain